MGLQHYLFNIQLLTVFSEQYFSFVIFIYFFFLDIITFEVSEESQEQNLSRVSCFSLSLSTMAAFTCTSCPPISLRSEMMIASSTKASLSTRQMFSVGGGGLRTRVSLSSVSKNYRASRLRRGGTIVCEAQETATGSNVLSSLSLVCWIMRLIVGEDS